MIRTRNLKIVRPDTKGRITLGALAVGVSGFAVTQDKKHRIILEPYTEIPIQEKWLFENKEALKQVQQGLQDSAQGHVRSLGSFKKYLKSKNEETE